MRLELRSGIQPNARETGRHPDRNGEWPTPCHPISISIAHCNTLCAQEAGPSGQGALPDPASSNQVLGPPPTNFQVMLVMFPPRLVFLLESCGLSASDFTTSTDYATSSSLPLIPFLSPLSFEIGRETRCFAYSGYQPSDITSSLSSLLVSSCLEAAARQRHFIIHRHVLTYRLRHDSSLFPQLLEQHTIIFSLPSFQTL